MRAFSLVELSIVLVILGLLTGGILAGQSLIRASELRSYVAESQRIITAGKTFRDKYMAIPGDMNSATRFWLRQTSVPATICNSNASIAVGTPGTCDGNGSGLIDNSGAASRSGERYQLWRQLSLAGLLEGDYTGLATAVHQSDHVPGVNCPAMRISTQACWSTFGRGVTAGSTGALFAGDYGNELATAFGSSHGLIFRPEEAWNVDTKLDDGKPATGRALGVATTECSGTTNETDTTAQYAVLGTSISCAIYFLRSF